MSHPQRASRSRQHRGIGEGHGNRDVNRDAPGSGNMIFRRHDADNGHGPLGVEHHVDGAPHHGRDRQPPNRWCQQARLITATAPSRPPRPGV